MKVSQSTVRRRLHEQKYRGYTRSCKPFISKKNRKARLEFGKNYRDEPRTFWVNVLWTDETSEAGSKLELALSLVTLGWASRDRNRKDKEKD